MPKVAGSIAGTSMTQVTGIATWLAPRVNLPPFAFADASNDASTVKLEA
jgi:hypothetical protein